MKNKSLELYFQINQAGYERLIDELLAEIKSQVDREPSEQLTMERRKYLEIAIARGVDFSVLPGNLGTMDAATLGKAARALPDKEAMGWSNRITKLTQDDRKTFSDSEAKRSPEMRWDNLFPEGVDDLLITFSEQEAAQSIDEKIEAYIDDHNARASTLLAEARAQDIAAVLSDPLARPKAGRNILQRQIRVVERADEEGKRLPAQIQSLNPNKSTPEKEIWEDGPTFGKFLQDQFAWDLLDLVQLATDPKSSIRQNADNIAASQTLRTLAHHSPVNTDDLFDTNKLRILVSRDPQKIGESSTGQRWISCMASNGVNYRFVPADIEKGSLIAYVVHEDDHAGRWPFMRVLLKPYRNDKGETVLVPGRIYGGVGNQSSRTRDALQYTLMKFVSKHNNGKSGKFDMDSSLYGDAQATTIMLKDSWSTEEISAAMIAYQQSALSEWTTEINNNKQLLEEGKLGPHKEDPAENIRKFKRKIQRLFKNADIASGLPRMFFRTMQGSSVGAAPLAKEIYDTAVNNETIKVRAAAFAALSKRDFPEWQQKSQSLPFDFKIQMIVAAIVMADDETTGEFADKIWQHEVAPYFDLDTKGLLPDQQKSVAETRLVIARHLCNVTDDKGILSGINALSAAEARCRLASVYLTRFKTSAKLSTAARQIIADDLPKIKSIQEGCDLAGTILFAPRSTEESRDSKRIAEAYLLDHFDDGVTAEKNRRVARDLLSHYCENEELLKKAENIISQAVQDNDGGFEYQLHLVGDIISFGRDTRMAFKHRIGKIHMKNVEEGLPQSENKSDYLKGLSDDLYLYRSVPIIQERIASFLLNNLKYIENFSERVRIINNITRNIPEKSHVKERAENVLIANYRAAFSEENRHIYLYECSWRDLSIYQYTPQLQQQLASILMKNLFSLKQTEDRTKVLNNILKFLPERSSLRKSAHRLLVLNRGLAFVETASKVFNRVWKATRASELKKLFRKACTLADHKTPSITQRQVPGSRVTSHSYSPT